MITLTLALALALHPLTSPVAATFDPRGGAAGLANAASKLNPNSTPEQILDALEFVGRDLKQFRANVSIAEIDPSTGEDGVKRTGLVLLQQSRDESLIRITLDKRITGKRVFDEKIVYAYAKGILEDRNYTQKIAVRRRILKQGEKLNLFQLGSGPFPLPIGQAREDVQQEFDVKKLEPGDDAPKGTVTVHLQLTPRPHSQFAKQYKTVDIYVDVETRLPRKIVTTPRGDSDKIRTTEFEKAAVNPEPPINRTDFELESLEGKGWNERDETSAK